MSATIGTGEQPSEPGEHDGLLLLRQLAQHGAVLSHDLLGHFHLRGKFGIERGQLDAAGRFQRVQFIALFQAQAGQQFLGQDDAGGIADGGAGA